MLPRVYSGATHHPIQRACVELVRRALVPLFEIIVAPQRPVENLLSPKAWFLRGYREGSTPHPQ